MCTAAHHATDGRLSDDRGQAWAQCPWPGRESCCSPILYATALALRLAFAAVVRAGPFSARSANAAVFAAGGTTAVTGSLGAVGTATTPATAAAARFVEWYRA